MNATAPLHTKAQIADWAGVSLRTVQTWVADGCPHFRLGRVVRFEIDAVRAWMQTPRDVQPAPRQLRRVR